MALCQNSNSKLFLFTYSTFTFYQLFSPPPWLLFRRWSSLQLPWFGPLGTVRICWWVWSRKARSTFRSRPLPARFHKPSAQSTLHPYHRHNSSPKTLSTLWISCPLQMLSTSQKRQRALSGRAWASWFRSQPKSWRFRRVSHRPATYTSTGSRP